ARGPRPTRSACPWSRARARKRPLLLTSHDRQSGRGVVGVCRLIPWFVLVQLGLLRRGAHGLELDDTGSGLGGYERLEPVWVGHPDDEHSRPGARDDLGEF